MIDIFTFVQGDISTNTYLIEDTESGELAVVDPACESKALVEKINQLGGKLSAVLLTHGHFDHIGGVAQLFKLYNSKIYIGSDELELLNNPQLNLSFWHNLHIDEIQVDVALKDGDEFELGNSEVKFITTPGHTGGSGCYIIDDCVFSGDTLFCQSIGRTDFPTSSPEQMIASLHKLSQLDGDYKVYPGHDISTTLSSERRYNPYMR